MDFAKAFDLHLVSFGLLLFVYFNTRRWTKENNSSRLFKYVIIAMLFNLTLDFFGWYMILASTQGDFARHLNFYLNTFIYATLALPLTFWIIYIDYKIYHDKVRLKKRLIYYFSPTILLVVLSLINLFVHVIFRIDSSGVYHRGPLFYLVVLIMYMVPVWSVVMVYRNRRTVSTRLIESILMFWIIPILAAIFQLFFYGWMITWPVFCVVTVFVYILVEKDAMLKDNLTQLDSRRVFEDKAKELIKRRVPFCLMIIDLNDFKSINDKYGHLEGDSALKGFASILKVSVKGSDILCRYGGDEFIALLPSDSIRAAEKVASRLESRLEDYNQKRLKDYTISISSGYRFYAHYEYLDLKAMLSQVDEHMYKNKENSRVNSKQ
ncbi:GGDEF domain-containing protein [Acidaminobacter sp. JC074]|uniref:GGDEF domain-containing protein n=1 Tax=Acidaminobacter sp. JC074 TaxID=2530199 RepID=UPI001F0EF076|nr:GGDEF domain-containing protein [Acidaminobacter sp. JC074]